MGCDGMAHKGGRVSLITKFSTLFIVVLAALSIGTFTYYAYCLQNMFDGQVNVQMDDLMGLGTSNVSNQIDRVDQLSVSLITDSTVQDCLPRLGDADVSGVTEQDLSAAVRENIFVVDGVRTAVLQNMSGDCVEVGTYFVTVPAFPAITEEAVIAANGRTLWDVDETGRYLCLARAILSTRTMQPIGWLEIVVDSASFDDGLHTIRGNGHGRLYLIDEEDRILSSGDKTLRGERLPYASETLDAWQNSRDPATIKDPATGEESLFRISSSLDNGWRLVVCVSRDEFYATLWASLTRIAIYMGAASLVVIAVVFALVRWMSRPIGEVIAQMNRFADGDLSARTQITSNDEIGEISAVYNHMAERIQDQHERVYRLELANKEAQIEFLKMQINPHFLYNSLDTMSWIAYMHGDEEVSDMAVAMAGLLRASIQREDFIPVEKEIIIVRDYLRIQEYRFGDKIHAHLDVDADTVECMIPGFILQPIIENSIVHGLESREDGGEVRISVKRLDHTLYCCVSDNGIGMTQEQLYGLVAECEATTGGKAIGVRNVYRRLHLIYGENCRISIESVQEQGTTVSFEIPIQMARTDRKGDTGTESSTERSS